MPARLRREGALFTASRGLARRLRGLSAALFPDHIPLGILIRLFLFALKPLILVFGAVKLFELFQQNRGENWSASEEREPLLDSPSGPPVE